MRREYMYYSRVARRAREPPRQHIQQLAREMPPTLVGPPNCAASFDTSSPSKNHALDRLASGCPFLDASVQKTPNNKNHMHMSSMRSFLYVLRM